MRKRLRKSKIKRSEFSYYCDTDQQSTDLRVDGPYIIASNTGEIIVMMLDGDESVLLLMQRKPKSGDSRVYGC